MRARHYLRAARPAAFGMIALPLLWGQGLAGEACGSFDGNWLLLALSWGVCAQVFALYLNDYADESVDRETRDFWLSGGSRVIPDGDLSAEQLLRASRYALAGMVGLSVAAAAHGRSGMLLLGALAVVAAQGYSLPPLRSSYRGAGALHQSLACGVLLPLTGYYLQCGTLLGFVSLSALALPLAFAASNIATALPDLRADAAGGKRTHPVRVGRTRARRDATCLLVAACVLAALPEAATISLPWKAGLVAAPALALAFAAGLSSLRPGAAANDHLFVSLHTGSFAYLLTAWTAALFLPQLFQGFG